MKKIFIIVLSIFSIAIFCLLLKFYPLKLNRRYLFNLNNYTQPEMRIIRAEWGKLTEPCENIKFTITNKKQIQEIITNILNNRTVPISKINSRPLLYTDCNYMIIITDMRGEEWLHINYLDSRYIAISMSSSNKGYKRYKFKPTDINLDFIEQIINEMGKNDEEQLQYRE